MKTKWQRIRSNPRDAILTGISGLIWVWVLLKFPILAWSIFGLAIAAGLFATLTRHK
ncbi:hypothetical protein [Lacticaseibacillus brantae]|uniref:Uncharacterized protein n=1 Tax=Lacticaseibacillus brantae DSM 23927 TaxID=1423727 RepID=A0A0R2B8J7_9LACO|nr:hypothetical protein [Lacticaseibacillus brantae]KRM71884.1 hypothetical protein FC34_GL000860 [Lacticaseibacillus brantae DSM 23927]